MQPSFRRVQLNNKSEGWIVYCHTEHGKHTDAAVVLFGENENHLYILSDSSERLGDEEYLNAVINLVHDLPNDFCVKKMLLKFSASEYYFDELVNMCYETSK